MTIASEVVRSGPYYPNGIVVDYPFDFRAISGDDVEFVRIETDGTETVVSPALYTVALTDTGGTVSFAAPLDVSALPHYVELAPSFKQEIDVENQSTFLPEVITEALDQAGQRALWLRDRVDRAFKVPLGESGLTLPTAAERANLFPVFDAEGNMVLSQGTGADAGLRVDLGGNGGGSLIGLLASGVGAVARSLADWFADEGSVMSYLSLAQRVKVRLRTTTAADAATHRAAFQAAIASRAGIIKVPLGLYWTNPDTPISPLSNQIIRGEGAGSEIRAIGTINNSYNIFRLADADQLAIEDLMVVGEKGIHASAGTGYVTGDIVSLTAQAGGGAGMRGTVTAYNGRIQRIDIDPANPGNGLYTHNGLVNLAAVTGAGVGGTWRVINRSVKTWIKGASYDAKDSYVKPGDGKAYMTAVSHTAGPVFADDLAAGNWVLVNPAGETVQAPYDGEGGMGIGIYQCTNVAVRRVIAKECWGDGIYVGGNGAGQCNTVLIEDCDCDSNRRQGVTIASAKNWKIVRGDFHRQGGTLPASGIDIEPNTNPGDGDVENGEIIGARCFDNYGAGLTCALDKTKKLRVIGVDSWGNGHSGGYFAGLGEGLELDGGNWFDNVQHGLIFQGTSTMTLTNARISRPRVTGNLLDGIVVRYGVTGLRLVEPIVKGNMRHGVRFEGYSLSVTDCALVGGDIRENGQATHNTFSNVWVGEDTPFLHINGVTIRRGLKPNQPRFGIRLNENNSVVVENCDLYVAGNENSIGSEVAANDINTTAGALSQVKLRNNTWYKTEGRYTVSNIAVDVAGYFLVNVPVSLGYLPQATDCMVSFVDPSGSQGTVTGNVRTSPAPSKTSIPVRVNVQTPAAAGIKYNMVLDVRRPSGAL